MNLMWNEDKKRTYGEKSINESIKRMMSITEPDAAIDDFLMYLGETCHGERTYIFEETENRTFSNTYEWCREGVTPQKDLLQNEPMETLQWWIDLFIEDKVVIIRDIEDIKEEYPHIYAGLKPQDIVTLISAPIRVKGKLIGFLGIDNADKDQLDEMANFLLGVGYFVSFVIERRNFQRNMEFLSYHDQLTTAWNRHAYSEFIQNFQGANQFGVVYCDVTELKLINDNMGHVAGDELIVHWYKEMKEAFPGDAVYRIGGDEFIILAVDKEHSYFELCITKLRDTVYHSSHHLAIGSAWSNTQPIELQTLISEAEKLMYQDKAVYYSQLNPISGRKRDRRQTSIVLEHLPVLEEYDSDLGKFLKQNYFDPVVFFDSIAMSDYYPFVGDLQSNLFYISDEMKETFGFQSNIISDLIRTWEKRVSDPEELDYFRNDIAKLLAGEKEYHDVRYRVKDTDGNDVWVHCHGRIKWNKDRTQPIFFSGGLSRQESNFIVDHVSNFPREYAATMKIQELQESTGMVTVIGFALNNFSEINELRGRQSADLILRKISRKLTEIFDGRLLFYRLDGMRFLALVHPNCEEMAEDLIIELKEVIAKVYFAENIVVQVPCSVGLICEMNVAVLPQEILMNMMTLLTEAKNNPDKDYLVHSPQNIHLQKERARITMDLNQSVMNEFRNFRIVIQPVVYADTERLCSGEVLLRWNDEDRPVSPAEFVPILEANRLILPVGRWVFEQAVRACKRITSSFHPEFRLAVNVSYYQILDPTFLPFMKETLQRYDLPGRNMILEITETHYDETPIKVRRFVNACKDMGMSVAIDDFGDGYSSLAFLIKYPTDIVKLDRSLINEMLSSQDNVNFISSIVYACHKFGKKVCAEGVETEEEFQIIRDSGCDMIQGFYMYRPMEVNDFYSILSDCKSKCQEDNIK